MDDKVPDEKSPDAQTRKTITLTHKQAGLTLGSVSTFFAILHFLNGNYASKSDAEVLKAQVKEVKSILVSAIDEGKKVHTDYVAEQIATHRRMADTWRDEIKNEKDDRIREVSVIENLFRTKKTQNN